MVAQPKLHADIYDAIDPMKFKNTMKGKVALIIGCARPGIGQAVAVVFAQAGAGIAAFDVQDTSETVSLAKKEGVEAKGWTLDARNEEAVSAAIDQVENDLGPIHVLVNLAGIVGSRPILMENYKNLMNTMEINFGGTMLSMLKVLPLMKKRRDGIIINVASRAGSKDFGNNLAYCVSKSAVIRATGCIQLQLDAEGLGDDIQLYALHPGGVLTDMTKAPIAEDVLKAYPHMAEAKALTLQLIKVNRFLPAATCLFIANRKATILKGRYFDCEQDIAEVVSAGPSEIVDKDLYRMKVDFLGGLPNDGGILKDSDRTPKAKKGSS